MKGLPRESDWLGPLTDNLFGARRRTNLVGIGNPIKQDDALGLEIVSRLRARLGSSPIPGLKIHPPSLNPERVLARLAQTSERIVVFDAVEANKEPGTIVCTTLNHTRFGYFATHNIPLRILPGIVDEGSDIRVVGMQPAQVDVGEGLSDVVLSSLGELVDAVVTMVEARK